MYVFVQLVWGVCRIRSQGEVDEGHSKVKGGNSIS